MTVIPAIIGALLLITVVLVASMRLTERKTTEELKERLPDASSVNADSGFATPGGGD